MEGIDSTVRVCLFGGEIGWMDGKFWRENEEDKLFEGCLVERGRGENDGGTHQKVLSPKWRENLVWENLIVGGQKCSCLHMGFFSIFFYYLFFLIPILISC